jgi:hypothetical protein
VTTDANIASTDARRWGLRMLELNDRTDVADTAAVLRFVTRSNYVLSEEAAEAAQAAINPANANPLAVKYGHEQRMAEAVSEFAAAFFQLPFDQRQARWKGLHDECQNFPSLSRWLDRLRSGLEFTEVPSSETAQLHELVQIICGVYTSKPPGSIRLRQEFVAAYLDKPEAWDAAFVELRTGHRYFMETIAPWIEGISSRIPDPDEMRQLRLRHDLKKKPPANEPVKGKSNPWWLMFFIPLAFRIVFGLGQASWPPPKEPDYIPRRKYSNVMNPPLPQPLPAETIPLVPGQENLTPEALEELQLRIENRKKFNAMIDALPKSDTGHSNR